MHVKAVIAYDGSYFKGFQRQKSTRYTITSHIESALRDLGIPSPIQGSGRTDAGVHATGQVINFELPEFWQDLNKLKTVLNRKLNHIQIKHITPISPDFHARFWAKRRIYRYVFKTHPPSLFEAEHVAYYPPFDPHRLNQALAMFEGEHDFSYFLKRGSTTHTNVRTIYRAHHRPYHRYHLIYFEANGFLRAQVRLMIDGAMQVAQGKLTLEQLEAQLSCQQRYTTRLAPPEGLYLARVIY